jgi:hypothetical protein
MACGGVLFTCIDCEIESRQDKRAGILKLNFRKWEAARAQGKSEGK